MWIWLVFCTDVAFLAGRVTIKHLTTREAIHRRSIKYSAVGSYAWSSPFATGWGSQDKNSLNVTAFAICRYIITGIMFVYMCHRQRQHLYLAC